MTNYPKDVYSIKAWAEEDRPREKMMLKGRAALSDSELLAIILGSGSMDENVVDLAKKMLGSVGNNLNALGKLSLKDLQKFKGVGPAKAISIAAAMELGRRRQTEEAVQKPTITSSKDAYQHVSQDLSDLPHEEFWVLMLNQSNRIVSKQKISAGGIAGTLVDIRIIFKKALEYSATSMVLAHNHPSGSLKPSPSDIELTKKIAEAGKTMEIKVLDHIIVGSEGGYYSFADEGKL